MLFDASACPLEIEARHPANPANSASPASSDHRSNSRLAGLANAGGRNLALFTNVMRHRSSGRCESQRRSKDVQQSQ